VDFNSQLAELGVQDLSLPFNLKEFNLLDCRALQTSNNNNQRGRQLHKRNMHSS